MNFKKILPIAFVLIFNLWLIKIFNNSLAIGVAVISGSVFIYLSIFMDAKKYLYGSVIFICSLMIFQYKTSLITSLTFLTESEKTEQIQRMHGYPPSLYRFANWLEQRKETLIFYKLEENFFAVMDPNLYFFASHPRERAGVVEFEKLPYIFLPFFILGLLTINKSKLNVLLLAVSPMILFSLIGNSSQVGPFSLFPLLSVYIAKGLEPVFNNKKFFFTFILSFGLVFIQTFSYATY